jgi:flagellar hook protein FlgE
MQAERCDRCRDFRRRNRFASYENGDLKPLYRIALARCRQPGQARPLAGQRLFARYRFRRHHHGFRRLGAFGNLVSGAQEGSNVDIAERADRHDRLPAQLHRQLKVFQTGSDLMDVLVNLKR